MSSWISALDGQVQTSPLLNAYSTRPSTALSRNSSSQAITSEKKMFGDFPPSSSVTGMMFCAAYCMIIRPVTVSPVKATFGIDQGVGEAGLMTQALPAASAGASFHAAISNGKLNGMIWPTTPSGSWKSEEHTSELQSP